MKRFTMRSMHGRQAGLSLVELAVALVIVGILGLIAWRWVASTRAPVERSAIMGELAQAQAAVEGFVLAHGRLPCAASGTDGLEQCANQSSAAVLLPWRSLGLSSRFAQLHYGANRGAGLDLSVSASATVSPDLGLAYSPDIPVLAKLNVSAVNTAATEVKDAIAAAQARRPISNGLDWCQRLRQFAAQPDIAGALKAGHLNDSVPVAFIVVHPGSNGVFEGNNVVGASGGWRFDLPGRPQDHRFDDLSVAVGPADLSARIGCTTRLGAMQAAAQGAYTAYDNARAVQEYWSLRVFDIEQAQSAVSSAITGVALSTLNVALGAANVAKGAVSAANTEGATFWGVALTAASTIAAGVELAFAVIDLEDAKEALEDSKAKEKAAQAYVIHIYETFAQMLRTTAMLDEKGLNP